MRTWLIFAQMVTYLIPYYRSVIICTGAFGVVYKGVYTKNGVPIDVAIKTIKRLVHQLDNEITINYSCYHYRCFNTKNRRIS